MGLRLPPSGFTDRTAARGTIHYACWLRRAGGWVVDLLIVSMINYLLTSVLSILAIPIPVGVLGGLVVDLVLASISIAYATLCLARLRGQTPGMRMFDIRCVPVSQRGAVTMPQALTRTLASTGLTAVPWLWYPHLEWVSLLVIAAYLWPLVDHRRQTPWDFVAATVVVDERGW